MAADIAIELDDLKYKSLKIFNRHTLNRLGAKKIFLIGLIVSVKNKALVILQSTNIITKNPCRMLKVTSI